MKFRIWFVSIFLFLVIIFVLSILYLNNDYRSDPNYVGVEYAELNIKIGEQGGLVSNVELSSAFNSYMSVYCSNLVDSKNGCLNKLEMRFESCIKETLSSLNLQSLDSELMHIEFRRFKLCIE